MKKKSFLTTILFRATVFSMLNVSGRKISFSVKKVFFVFFLSFFIFQKFFASADFDLKHNATHIWSDSSGTSWLWRWNESNHFDFDGHKFDILVNFDYAKSSLDLLKAETYNFFTEVGYSNKYFGFSADFNYFESPEISLKNEKRYSQKDVKGFGGFFSGFANLPHSVKIKQSIGLFKLNSQSGDFYDFFGNFDLTPVFYSSFEVLHSNHKFNLFYGNLRLSVNSNDDEYVLFNGNSHFWGTSYSFILDFRNIRFEQKIGYFGFSEFFSGSLTSENQGYMFFPYKYLNLENSGSAHIAFFSDKATINFKNSYLKLNLILFFVPYGNFEFQDDWQKKKSVLFDGSQGADLGNFKALQFAGLVIPKIDYNHKIKIGKIKGVLSIGKIFVIPFKFGSEIFSQNQSSVLSSESLIANIGWYLLSGINSSLCLNF